MPRGREPGFNHTIATRQKMSIAALGRKHKPETIEKLKKRGRPEQPLPVRVPGPEPMTEAREVQALLDKVHAYFDDQHIEYMSYACGGMHQIDKLSRAQGWGDLEELVRRARARAWDDCEFHQGMIACLDMLDEHLEGRK